MIRKLQKLKVQREDLELNREDMERNVKILEEGKDEYQVGLK